MKTINITYCSCNKYVHRNQWKPYKTLKALISEKIRKVYPRAKLEFNDFKLPEAIKQKTENEVIAKVKGKEHVVNVIVKLAKCNLCEKAGTNYYEAILQVRSSSNDLLEKSIEFLKIRVENLKHRGMFINKIKSAPEGFDLFMTNRKVTQMLGKELYETFGGVLKTSPKLFTRNRQTSKNVYRVNVLVRLPGFIKNDIIVTDDDKVLRVDKLGKTIKLFDLEKKSTVNADYSKLSYHVLTKHLTYVARSHPYIEVINPLDFQASMIRNQPKKKLDPGQEVTVVFHKGLFLIE